MCVCVCVCVCARVGVGVQVCVCVCIYIYTQYIHIDTTTFPTERLPRSSPTSSAWRAVAGRHLEACASVSLDIRVEGLRFRACKGRHQGFPSSDRPLISLIISSSSQS